MKELIFIKQLKFALFLSAFIYFADKANASTPNPEQKTKAPAFMSKQKQLGFTENKGQMIDMKGNPAPYVLYKAEAPNLNIWVTEKGLTYQFFKSVEIEKEGGKEEEKGEWHRVDMILKDAQIKKENIVAENNITQGIKNYYLGHCPKGIFNVKTFSKITIKEIYKGIDWVLYANNQLKGSALKYDFVVHPNADPKQIKLIYEGSGRLEMLNNQIHFENPIGEMNEGKLFCYQGDESNEVESKFIIQKNQDTRHKMQDDQQSSTNKIQSETPNTQLPNPDFFSYEIGIQLTQYDQSKELTIDPLLYWSTFFGGNDWDGLMSMDCDANNNLFVTGYTQSLNFPLLNPGGTTYYQGVNATLNDDVFIMRFNATGVLQWATYYGDTIAETGNAIAVSPSGDVYVVGRTSSTNLPIVNLPGAYNQAVFGGAGAIGDDAFILRFSNTGTLLWSTYYGGSADESASGICFDNAGNVFITGYTSSANFPMLPLAGAYNQAFGGGGFYGDAFILKFSNVGLRLWATCFGGNADEKGNSICIDPTGKVSIAGETASSLNLPITSSGSTYTQAAGGFLDIFVAQFSNVGAALWSMYYGGSLNESAYGIRSDNLGNLFVIGYTESLNFPVLNSGGGAYYQGVYGGGAAFPWTGDGLILKFNNAGARVWATYFGGSGGEKISEYDAIEIDGCNNVYVSFVTTSTNMPLKNPNCASAYFDGSYNGGSRDLYVGKFSNNGIYLWGTYFSGNSSDFRGALAVDGFNNLFYGGEWATSGSTPLVSSTYPTQNPGNGAYFVATHNGDDDSFVAKFIPTVPSTISSSLVNATACICNGSATVVVSCGSPPYSYVWSNNVQSLNDTNNTNTITNLCPGIYTVTVTSNCYQPFQAVFNVTSSGSGTNVLITQNPVICTGQSYTFPDGSIGTTTSSQIDTIPASGSGCDTIITTNLSVVNAISTTINPAICSGQTYTFPDNSTSTIATTYSDTTQLTGGCDSIHTINLTVTLAATFTQTPSICSGQTFTRPGGAIVIAASTYYDTIKVGGCDSIITTILTVNALPNVSGGATQNIPCIPNSIAITASSSTAGANYNWTGPGTITNGTTNNPTVNAAGTYTVTVTDGNGCTNTSTVIVTNNNPLPSATATGTTIPCTQTTDTINANSTTANVTYNWSGPGIVSGGTTNNPTVNAAGTYTVTITDPITGCTNTATATVVVTPSPTASVSADVTIIQGASTTLTASGSTNYVWTPTTNLNPTTGNTVVASPTITTTYCVEVSDNNGCKDTACVTVTVELPCPENENLDVPNAFSPNKDGVNDEFCLQGWESCIENFSILIYNRWGEKVYESKDPNFCWDGTYRGKELDAQVFVYQLKARFININEPIIKKGNISLIR